jgi:hypothetical protein
MGVLHRGLFLSDTTSRDKGTLQSLALSPKKRISAKPLPFVLGKFGVIGVDMAGPLTFWLDTFHLLSAAINPLSPMETYTERISLSRKSKIPHPALRNIESPLSLIGRQLAGTLRTGNMAISFLFSNGTTIGQKAWRAYLTLGLWKPHYYDSCRKIWNSDVKREESR